MNQETVKCVKCQKDVSAQNGKKTPKGFVCKSCMRKNVMRKVYAAIGGVIMVAIVGIVIYRSQSSGESDAVGFEGVGNIQDSVAVAVEKPKEVFKLETAVAQSNPVRAGETIDNIESFRRMFAENVQKAEAANEGTVVLPNIGMLFMFDSHDVVGNVQMLLEEYAKAYLQTNRQATVLVEGFACNIGTDEANNKVSRQRAETVREALIAAGVPREKIEVKWYGKSRNGEFSYSTNKEYRKVIVSIK